MHTHPEALGEHLDQLARAQRGILFQTLARERHDLIGQLVRAPRTRTRGHQRRQPAAVVAS